MQEGAHDSTSGADLKAWRKGANISRARLAREMRVSPSRIRWIEMEPHVTPEVTERWAAGLEAASRR